MKATKQGFMSLVRTGIRGNPDQKGEVSDWSGDEIGVNPTKKGKSAIGWG